MLAATATTTASAITPGAPSAPGPGGPAPSAVAIACRGLHKRFGAVQALAGADLEVEAGAGSCRSSKSLSFMEGS